MIEKGVFFFIVEGRKLEDPFCFGDACRLI